MNQTTNNENKQIIYYRDVYKQKQKLSLVKLNTKKMVAGEYRLNSELFEMSREVTTIEQLESSLSFGLNSAIVYRNLLFIKITEKLWTIHHKKKNGEIRHFETIDFTTFLEHDLFECLIEEMMKGPENYWSVEVFREIPKNYADRVIEDFLNGHIKAKSAEDSVEVNPLGYLESYDIEAGWAQAYLLREERSELNLYETMWRWQNILSEDDCFYDTGAHNFIDFENKMKFCAGSGPGQSVSYRNLLFILSSEKVWCVYHTDKDGNMTLFEIIDFTPYIEHDLFSQLIEGMVKGPEYYWGIPKYTSMFKNKSQQILSDFLNGEIEPSEEMMEYYWVQMMTMKNREKKKYIEISSEELPF